MAKNKRFEYLVELGCVACRLEGYYDTPCEIHHCRGYEFSGVGVKAGDDETFGLCYYHHRGQGGFHHSPAKFKKRYGTQRELLDYTNRQLRRMGYDNDESNTEEREPESRDDGRGPEGRRIRSEL